MGHFLGKRELRAGLNRTLEESSRQSERERGTNAWTPFWKDGWTGYKKATNWRAREGRGIGMDPTSFGV